MAASVNLFSPKQPFFISIFSVNCPFCNALSYDVSRVVKYFFDYNSCIATVIHFYYLAKLYYFLYSFNYQVIYRPLIDSYYGCTIRLSQAAFTCSSLTIETVEQDMKYVQS